MSKSRNEVRIAQWWQHFFSTVLLGLRVAIAATLTAVNRNISYVSVRNNVWSWAAATATHTSLWRDSTNWGTCNNVNPFTKWNNDIKMFGKVGMLGAIPFETTVEWCEQSQMLHLQQIWQSVTLCLWYDTKLKNYESPEHNGKNPCSWTFESILAQYNPDQGWPQFQRSAQSTQPFRKIQIYFRIQQNSNFRHPLFVNVHQVEVTAIITFILHDQRKNYI